jgi:hypothetical protein
MAEWGSGGGFSVDASVRVEAADRAGLERRLRYCARPPFALERLAANAQRRIYHLPKAQVDGCTELLLTPLELIDRLAALIPPPRTHRHRYHGVLAPNATLRAAVTALAREALNDAQQQTSQEKKDTVDAVEAVWRSPARYLWAMLLARISAMAPALLYLLHPCSRTRLRRSPVPRGVPIGGSSPSAPTASRYAASSSTAASLHNPACGTGTRPTCTGRGARAFCTARSDRSTRAWLPIRPNSQLVIKRQ